MRRQRRSRSEAKGLAGLNKKEGGSRGPTAIVIAEAMRAMPLPPDVRTPRTVQTCGAECVRASSPAATVNATMPDAPHNENEQGGENVNAVTPMVVERAERSDER